MQNNSGKRSLFRRIYFIAVIAALLLLVVGMIILRGQLRDYENSQPEHMAKETFEKYFAKSSPESLTRLLAEKDATDEEKAALKEKIEKVLGSGKLTFREVSSGSQSNYEKYMVRAGDKNLASFTLVKQRDSEKQILFSILTLKYSKYNFGSIKSELDTESAGDPENEKDTPELNSVRILAPTGYNVFVDGELLGEDYVVEDGVAHDDIKFTLPEGLTPKTATRYSCKIKNAQPEIKCTSPFEMPSQVTYNEERGEYVCSFVYDDYLRDQYEPLILEAAEVYSRYLTNDAPFAQVAYYLDPGSLLYQQTQTTQTGFVIEHYGYEFQDESTSEYMSWGESVFSVRVHLKQILHKYGEDDFFEILDKVYFFRIDGTDLYIFDSFNMN